MTVEFPGRSEFKKADLFPPSYIRNGAIYAMKREVLIEDSLDMGLIALPL